MTLTVVDIHTVNAPPDTVEESGGVVQPSPT